ncbi:MAG: histidine phosphatase family protein [Pseudomonadota bacterium]
MTIKLAFMRHGHTSWNRAHKIQGRTDIPLDMQAKTDLAALRLPEPFAQYDIWSSPLSRARETAELISDTTPLMADALMEMDWGDWEGKHGVDLIADPNSGYRDLENWGWKYTPPNGESPKALYNRLLPWLSSRERDAVVIAHIGTMRVALAHAYDWNFLGPCPFTIKRNRLFVIEGSGTDWTAWSEPVRLEKRI